MNKGRCKRTKSNRPGITRLILLTFTACLMLYGASLSADARPDDDCCAPYGPYGNGSYSLDVPPGGYVTLEGDMDYKDVTVGEGATLDTAGYRLRVCGTLTNYGTITDTHSGGSGGPGGEIGGVDQTGLGADPCQECDPPDCDCGLVECTDGEDGDPGEPGLPDAGDGGHGGGSGGGGGGAWWEDDGACQEDADGGDGAAGGAGGQGGGYVIIYAYQLVNYGHIHADGFGGSDGEDAPNSYILCGAAYTGVNPPPPDKDMAGGGGGGGGGGAGGAGGNGGTVEIQYAFGEGEFGIDYIHATGGLGGNGGSGGLGGTQQVDHALYYGVDPGGHAPGCPGGSPGGGHGGRGASEFDDWAENGADGDSGSPGQPGLVILDDSFDDCNANGIPDACDIATGVSQDCNNNGIPDECDIFDGLSDDCNCNGIPDECEFTCYTITDLGTLDGDSYSQATGINDIGEVVGWSHSDIDPSDHAFYWSNGPMDYLKPLDNHNFTRAFDINESSIVAGWSWTGHTTEEEKLAVIWQKQGDEWEVIDLGCPEPSEARAINDHGHVVGFFEYYGSGPDHAFLYLTEPACDLPADCNDLHPNDPTASQSMAFDINNNSNVVGWSKHHLDGMLWEEIWHWRCLEPDTWDPLFSDYYLEPRGVNNLDWVVGGETHPFLCKYELDEWECVDLPGLGGTGGSANAVNDSGQIVGWARTATNSQRACIWEDGAVYDLNGRVPLGYEWVLAEATDINEAGQIVGYGLYQDQTRAFLLTPVACDCNDNGILDECELLCNDCNGNGIPDDCDIDLGISEDVNPANGFPDECDNDDCNDNEQKDWIDIASYVSYDCNVNGVPDECDIADGIYGDCKSVDLNENEVPDECEYCPCDICDSEGRHIADGVVDINDLFCVLANWGPCPPPCPPYYCFGDVNRDCWVNFDDITTVLGCWGPCAIGACCFSDGYCEDLNELDCIDACGTFYGKFTTCAEFKCPCANNDACEQACWIEIDGPSEINDTTGKAIPHIPGCGSAGDLETGTLWYYVIGNGTELKASLCNEGSEDWDADLSIFCGPCDDLLCVDGVDAGYDPDCVRDNNVLPEVYWCSEPGIVYYIAVYGNEFANPNHGVFELTVESGEECYDYPTCYPQ